MIHLEFLFKTISKLDLYRELNRLRRGYNGCYTDGHSRLHFARICGGIYPEILTEQWKLWHRAYGKLMRLSVLLSEL